MCARFGHSNGAVGWVGVEGWQRARCSVRELVLGEFPHLLNDEQQVGQGVVQSADLVKHVDSPCELLHAVVGEGRCASLNQLTLSAVVKLHVWGVA